MLSVKNLPANPPTVRSRGHRLDTLPRCRREVAKLYAEAREGKLDAQTATWLASIVALAARLIGDAELEARIARLEADGAGQEGRPRRHGEA